jgi:2-keto-4-pentenoate hydratase/2-oxohepta-3-ene-1,7-dioic acid hydratase in catechol pathway
MKIVRYLYKNEISYGIIEGGKLQVYAGSPFETQEARFKPVGEQLTLSEVRLLAPCQPSKIVCLGLNYKPHGDELKMKLPEVPLLFLKPSTAVIGPNEYIILPPDSERIDYECELAAVIGRKARNVKEADYASYILGYTCFNDVTDRIAQTKDGQWTRAKSYDTFAPVGPCIETEIYPFDLCIETRLNGVVVQSGNTRDLIFPVPFLVSFISRIMTLLPGDIIATGTPAGIGPIKAGDIVEIVIESIGILRNPVASANNKQILP